MHSGYFVMIYEFLMLQSLQNDMTLVNGFFKEKRRKKIQNSVLFVFWCRRTVKSRNCLSSKSLCLRANWETDGKKSPMQLLITDGHGPSGHGLWRTNRQLSKVIKPGPKIGPIDRQSLVYARTPSCHLISVTIWKRQERGSFWMTSQLIICQSAVRRPRHLPAFHFLS